MLIFELKMGSKILFRNPDMFSYFTHDHLEYVKLGTTIPLSHTVYRGMAHTLKRKIAFQSTRHKI
jgi:hypothetical protein